MLDKLSLFFAVVSLLMGSILLYDAVSKSDLTQTARVIGGAVFFALGLVTLTLVAKDWSKWRKHHKDAGRSISD
jgi:uncharacterized membrane protein